MSKSPVHISTMSGKLEGFRSISVNTVTNEFCQKMNKAGDKIICSKCYSMDMLKGFRKNTAPALQRNSDLLSSRVLTHEEVPMIKDKVFRFDSHGELINAVHLRNYLKIAELNPNTTFTLWTKRRDLISQHMKRWPIPKNLILIYSNSKVDDIMVAPPRFFHKTFNNVTDRYKGEANCTGQKCKDCLLCYTWNDTKTIVEHVK